LSNNKVTEGVLPIFKPKGMTSHDVVARLRRILKTKHIGHTGTLDPEVTGVLPICIGKATRIAELIMDLPKEYKGELTLGISTTTEDAHGDVINETTVNRVTSEEIQKAFQTFEGEIEQIPPMYSSVKVNGKHLYELAREGKIIERKPRRVKIYSLKMLNYYQFDNHPKVEFLVTCSKGTYIRTLCVDIGKSLGYPAHMSQLVRTKSGPFHLNDTISLEKIQELVEQGTLDQFIVPMAESLPHLPEARVPNYIIERKIYNGQKIVLQLLLSYEGLVKICDENGKLVAIYEKNENESIAFPKKVFKED